MVVRIAGKRMHLWRAVDHEGEILGMLGSTVTPVLTNPEGTRVTGVEYYGSKERQVQPIRPCFSRARGHTPRPPPTTSFASAGNPVQRVGYFPELVRRDCRQPSPCGRSNQRRIVLAMLSLAPFGFAMQQL
jgi:hypothetical protein